MALRVWLPLDGNLNNKGVSGATASLMGSGVSYAAGKLKQCAQLPNNANSCIYMTGLKQQVLSWSCWFKCLGNGSGNSQRILSEGRDTGSRGTEIWLSKDGATLYAATRGKDLNTSVTTNKWHHVCLTASATKVSLYLDGVLKVSQDSTTTTDYAQSQDAFVIGKMSYNYTTTTNYFPFNGLVNDVRIYDECLSPKQVKELSKGLVAHYKFDKITEYTTNKIAGLQDVSGYGYNGTKNGSFTNPNIDSARYDKCMTFSSGYLHYLSSPLHTTTDEFSISCWFYPTTNSTMCLYNDRTGVGVGIAIFYIEGKLRFDDGTLQTTGGSVTLNAWNHVVCTYKRGGDKKIYINNVLTTTATASDLSSTGANASIGNSSTNGAAGAGNQITGHLSDFRIYCTELSADDVKELYQTSAIVDNNSNVFAYEFIEEE